MAAIPLRADQALLKAADRRSFTRATTAIVMAKSMGRKADVILRMSWKADDAAERVPKAISNPLDTSDFAESHVEKRGPQAHPQIR